MALQPIQIETFLGFMKLQPSSAPDLLANNVTFTQSQLWPWPVGLSSLAKLPHLEGRSAGPRENRPLKHSRLVLCNVCILVKQPGWRLPELQSCKVLIRLFNDCVPGTNFDEAAASKDESQGNHRALSSVKDLKAKKTKARCIIYVAEESPPHQLASSHTHPIKKRCTTNHHPHASSHQCRDSHHHRQGFGWVSSNVCNRTILPLLDSAQLLPLVMYLKKQWDLLSV